MFYIKLTSLNVTDSPLSVTNIAQLAILYIKLSSLDDFPLEDGPISPTGQFKQSFDSFYVTDSPLGVTNIAQLAMLYKKLTSLDNFPLEDGQLVQLNSLNKS